MADGRRALAQGVAAPAIYQVQAETRLELWAAGAEGVLEAATPTVGVSTAVRPSQPESRATAPAGDERRDEALVDGPETRLRLLYLAVSRKGNAADWTTTVPTAADAAGIALLRGPAAKADTATALVHRATAEASVLLAAGRRVQVRVETKAVEGDAWSSAEVPAARADAAAPPTPPELSSISSGSMRGAVAQQKASCACGISC